MNKALFRSLTRQKKDENGKRKRVALEVDFVCNMGYYRTYIQSAFAMESDAKQAQELASLCRLRDGFQRVLVAGPLQPT